MPLALLLHDTFGHWRRDITRLAGWNRLVELELTLLDRARGVFMARWFGTGLPMFAGDLRIAIANLNELRARYRELRRQAMGGNPDLNLTEPLAGITGTMVGALLAPTSSMALMAVISEQMPNWITTLAAALNWLTAGALSTALFAAGVPIAAVALTLEAIAHRGELAAVHGFLGALAGLFVAARRFLEQLLGPRGGVQNPLLKGLLDMLDHLAELLPFIFALVTFVVVWIGPKLEPLARQLDILIGLARDVFGIVAKVLADLFDRLHELYVGKHSPWAIVQGIISTLRQWFKTLLDEFVKLFKIAAPAFEKVPVPQKDPKAPPKKEIRAWLEIHRALEDAFAKVIPFIEQMTTKSWLVELIKEIRERFEGLAAIKLVKHPAKPAEPSAVKEKLLAAAPKWPATLNFPELPKIPDFPSAESIYASVELQKKLDDLWPSMLAGLWKPKDADVFVLGPDARKKLEQIRRPPMDVFAAERRMLFEGKKPEEWLATAQRTEAELRTMLFEVIDRVLPPAVAAEVPKLQGLLWELDDFLYGQKAEFPVRDLPGGDRLSLKVGRLRIRAPGMRDTVLKVWSKDLKTALQNEIYRTAVEVKA